MKNLLRNMSVFIVLALAFSSFTACTNSTNPANGAADANQPAAANSAESNTGTTSKSSEYPPVPAGVLQAEIKNLDGNVFKIEDLKGKVVLLNLWATWCGPCRKEMPELVAMEDEFKAKDFKIIGLNVDEETPEQIKPFAEEMKLNYELAWTDENLYRELLKISKFNGIPQSFLIDRNGHLRGIFVGGSDKVIKQLRENVEKTVNEQ